MTETAGDRDEDEDEPYEPCSRCGEYWPADDVASKPGSFIGMWRDDAGHEPGYYRVKRWPFYADGIIEGYFIHGAIAFAAPLDDVGERAALQTRAVAGQICTECHGAIEKHIIARLLVNWPAFGHTVPRAPAA